MNQPVNSLFTNEILQMFWSSQCSLWSGFSVWSGSIFMRVGFRRCGVWRIHRVLNDSVVLCHTLFRNDQRQQTAKWFLWSSEVVFDFCGIADCQPCGLRTICLQVSGLLWLAPTVLKLSIRELIRLC